MKRFFAVCAALAVLFVALYAVVLHPLSKDETYQVFGTLISRVETQDRVVALTFDDGPSPRHTGTVLEILAEQNATVTFFLTGHEVERRPDLAREIVEAAHDLANHPFSHNRLILKRPSTIRWELDATDALLRNAGFEDDLQFRAPYGQKLFSLPWVLDQQDRPNIMWDVEAGSEDLTPEEMAEAIVEAAGPGSIILMHVMYDSRETSRAALPLVIQGLRAKGFELIGLNDLLARAP